MITSVGCCGWPTGPAPWAPREAIRLIFPAPDSPQRKEQLRRLAASGMTVPRNHGDLLPLGRDARVAVIGRHAIETTDMGGGSAQVNPPYRISVAEWLTSWLGDAVTVIDGVEVRHRAEGSLRRPASGRRTGADWCQRSGQLAAERRRPGCVAESECDRGRHGRHHACPAGGHSDRTVTAADVLEATVTRHPVTDASNPLATAGHVLPERARRTA